MKQPYIGNTKINKLYKGSELWCNWSSGGESTEGVVTNGLMCLLEPDNLTTGATIWQDKSGHNNNFYIEGANTFTVENNACSIADNVALFCTPDNLPTGTKTYEIYYKRINTAYYNSLMYIGEKLCLQLTPNGYTIRVGGKNYGGTTDAEPLPKKDLSSVIGVIVSQNYIKVYQNGNILKTYTCDNSNILNFRTKYYIGKRSDNGDRKAKYIYSFKIYNRELTEEEIIRNYNYEMRNPVIPSTFDTIIFCQKNNNIIQNGDWKLSSYNCYTGAKSLSTSDNSSSITSNVLSLPPGSYKWSMYYYNSETCILTFSVEGDYFAKVDIIPGGLANLDFNTIMTFNITKPSNITLKLSGENASNEKHCRFFDWKLEKIN